MKVIRGFKNLERPIKESVLTIGVFDGVHLGHKKIIKAVVSRARILRIKSVVLTFDPHPLKVLNRDACVLSLISLDHRIKLIDELGIDYLIVAKFTKSISSMEPSIFVKKILVNKLGLKEIYVGDNFYFGKGAGGDIKVLKKISGEFGFRVKIFKPVRSDGHIISSSLIRHLIINGKIRETSKFLGRPVSILGTVVKGRKIGRILGFPTANIDPHHEAIPPGGVYAVRVRFKNRLLKGVLNIGTRPTLCVSPAAYEPTIEVHIFDFNRQIYGQDLEIIFVKKIRDERRFKNKDKLISRIRLDSELVRRILK